MNPSVLDTKVDAVCGARPSLERAKVQYAAFHHMDVDKVTEKMLSQSPEGVEGWACYGQDSKARGPMGNAMYRQIKKYPQAAEAYKWLFDDLRKKFRQTWAMNRNFDFISRKRSHTISTMTKQEEIGSWKSELQLQAHFGGVDQPEAQRQAANYIASCKKYEDWSCFFLGVGFILVFLGMGFM